MGKKKRSHPDLDEVLARPWCFYCERDFDDLRLLISHQKAKHFKCDRCGKRLNTAGGLSVHMNQVHKETLTHVENALSNRQGLDTEIFGMEGIPDDIVQQRNQRVTQNYFQAQADRYAATGNPPPGQSGNQGPRKKIKMETPEELNQRLKEWMARKKNGTAPPVATDTQSPGQGASPFPPPQAGYPYPPAVPAIPGVPGVAGMPGVPSYSPTQTYPPAYPPGPSPPPGAAPGAFNLPARPPSNGPPQPYYNGAGAPPSGLPAHASTLDELVSGAARSGDDIDQLIRMAEAGIKPAKEEGVAEKKPKKDKNRMVYSDSEVSPEEKMAMLQRYAFAFNA